MASSRISIMHDPGVFFALRPSSPGALDSQVAAPGNAKNRFPLFRPALWLAPGFADMRVCDAAIDRERVTDNIIASA